MPAPLHQPPLIDLAPVGNGRSTALVDRTGSIPWLCLPEPDSPSVFASLVGSRRHGSWSLGPASPKPVPATRRAYRAGSLVLDQVWEMPDGSALQITDFMPATTDDRPAQVIRTATCLRGQVTVSSRILIAPDYGRTVARLGATIGTGGVHRLAAEYQDATLWLDSDGTPHRIARGGTAAADTALVAGQQVTYALSWQQPDEPAVAVPDGKAALAETLREWDGWTSRCTYTGPYRDAVLSSLAILASLIHSPTGGIIAAPTTSLPEEIGGERNYCYRYTWLRDSALIVRELLRAGHYLPEVRAWRRWLVDTIGDPATVKIMYRLDGTTDLTETTLDHLPGYQGSLPVRIGNGAADQLQLDVFGYVADALLTAEEAGLEPDPAADALLLGLAEVVAANWHRPDRGIWEIRGPERHFTSSKVLAWVALDRTVALLERRSDADSPALARLRELAARIHADVLANGYDREKNSFVQYYGGQELDASLLLLPLLGFLPADDKRVIGTIEAVQRDLATYDGLVLRYRTHQDASANVDGLRGHEGAFVACSFWLVSALDLIGRSDEATERMDVLLDLRSDVGVLAEEVDPATRQHLGNTPLGLSHLALVNAALTRRSRDVVTLPQQRLNTSSTAPCAR
ncbi:glycoside hydrolase family 15 protein [Kitasatospora cineracea]|uniref:GH15 family glucan-1,4-alpha-glucosidase n=1 Tax=Kitasatospora cineracea TaxID=88074 RepID=A0A8G1XDY8_9ACTN|nr:glycoside hydrolase family 15 protein [Kitasatospora cineracea]ROR44736.1 GH15 family glucan-1,4-alpha-glucosidase [Kitasatospora cineracea]